MWLPSLTTTTTTTAAKSTTSAGGGRSSEEQEHADERRRAFAGLVAIAAVSLTATVVIVAILASGDRSKGSGGSGSINRQQPSSSSAGGVSPELPQPSSSSATLRSEHPSPEPSSVPSSVPSPQPTMAPTTSPTFVEFNPGELTVLDEGSGLLLSTGLTARVVARSGEKVAYRGDGGDGDKSVSALDCHTMPDFGAVFSDPRDDNDGGWIYVSNSEVRNKSQGGVGAFTFDRDGKVVDYRMLLVGTTSNCGGGKTPWDTWVSCEETGGGQNYQVDPTGTREPQVITLGSDGGNFESFAYDLYADDSPQFFVTEDTLDGALQRFRPIDDSSHAINWTDPWTALHGPGRTDFLILNSDTDMFAWSRDRDAAKANAEQLYPNSEGIDCVGGYLYFVSKLRRVLFVLDLHDGTYTSHSTEWGAFDAQPDQVARIVKSSRDLLFFTEDGGRSPGIHARNRNGEFFAILEATEMHRGDETTGLAFSPDGRHMYFALQDAGLIFDVTRTDGLPFQSKTLNIKYHAIT